MSTRDQLLIVSTLGDGPYWQSILEILSPPSGVSFYRPFSYRVDWVDDSVLEAAREGDQLGPLKAIVGMRFRSRSDNGILVQRPLFLPLRRAEAVVVRKGELSIRLRLDDFVKVDDDTREFERLEIPTDMNEKEGSAILLRFATEAERAKVDIWPVQPEPDYRLWQLLVESDAIPEQVQQRFEDQVVVYATALRRIGDDAPVSPVEILSEKRVGGASTYGYQLQVGGHYEIDLQARRIGPPGSPAFPESRPEFRLLNDQTTLISSAPAVPFTGNYRHMPVWIRPLHHVAAPLDIWWHPQPIAGHTKGPSHAGLRIPFIANRVFPRLQAALALIFITLGVLGYFWAITSQRPSRTLLAILLSVGTLLVSAGTQQVVEATRRWDDQG